jgi:hypothetical protein
VGDLSRIEHRAAHDTAASLARSGLWAGEASRAAFARTGEAAVHPVAYTGRRSNPPPCVATRNWAASPIDGRGGTALARARLRATSLDRVRLQLTGGTAPAQALFRLWLAQPLCTRRSRLAPREFFVALCGALIFLLRSSEHLR